MRPLKVIDRGASNDGDARLARLCRACCNQVVGQCRTRQSLQEILYFARPCGGAQELKSLLWVAPGERRHFGGRLLNARKDSFERLYCLLAERGAEVRPGVPVAHDGDAVEACGRWDLLGEVEFTFAEIDGQVDFRNFDGHHCNVTNQLRAHFSSVF